jgi:hypothetical protein
MRQTIGSRMAEVPSKIPLLVPLAIPQWHRVVMTGLWTLMLELAEAVRIRPTKSRVGQLGMAR